jgi:hypothetical protein
MKQMLLYFILGAALLGCAGSRPVQTSQKKVPQWLHGIEQGYVIAVGKGATHEEARNRALLAVREQIVNAIAVQVVSSAESVTRDERQNQVNSFVDHFETTVDVNSEYFDALKGISVTRVADFYWAQHGRQPAQEIHYHIKYPFSDSELQGLIADFEAWDREIESQIDAIQEQKHYKSVEEIIQRIGDLDYLADIAANDKKKRARALKTQLEYMIMDIRIARLEDRPGFIRYYLQLYDRRIDTRQTPDIFATCPVEVSKVSAFPEYTEVDYTFDRCEAGKDQTITVSYLFDGIRVERNFSFAGAPKTRGSR